MAGVFLPTGLLLSLSVIFCVAVADQVDTSSLSALLPIPEIFTCGDLGFKGATLNKCGYCIDGNTNLKQEFGVDCDATCGRAFVDCTGTCNGQSYIDECSGKCVLDYQPAVKAPQEVNATLEKNVTVRDCSGLCRPRDQLDTGAFALDSCGVCVAAPEPTSDNTTSNSSKFRDCSGTCYHPAASAFMAVNTSDTCYQCVGPRTTTNLNDYRDSCGNCKTENIPCTCTTGQLDMCGICNGQNDTCTTITAVFPAVIPSDTVTMISVTGVSLKSKHHTICLFIRQDLAADGKDEERFPAEIHETNINCNVRLSEGIYKLHLAVMINEKEVMSMSNASLPFIAYSKSATIAAMLPAITIISDDHDNFTVTFNAQNMNRIRVVHCTISGIGYAASIRTTSPNITNGLVNCTFPYPVNSSTAKVIVSFDGETTIARPFPLTFFAASPMVTNAYILPKGLSMVIFFNRNINAISNLSTCDAFLSRETVGRLGTSASCVWVTKRQLIVTLGHSVNPNSGANGTNLTFKDNVLYAENEAYAVASKNVSLSLIPPDESPVAVLVGPQHIPPCGSFTLDGHQSIGVQNRRAKFAWGLSQIQHSLRDARLTNATQANETFPELILGNETQSNETRPNVRLIRFLEAATRKNLPSVTIDSSLLELEEPYNFTLTVSNTAGAHNVSSTTYLVLVQELDNIPTVMIEPSVAHFPGFVSIDKGFSLHAYMAMPACHYEIYSIDYRWSVSSPKVKFDFAQTNKKSYFVKPWTLFPSKNLTFTVRVTLNSNPNMSSEASITFGVVSSKIKMVLTGGYQRTIGSTSGTLVVNASQSYHIDAPHLPLVYRWSCVDQDGNPCHNYDVSSDDVLLIPKPITRSGILSVATNRLRPGTTLMFNVQAFSPVNATQLSEPGNVLIKVRRGIEPVVSIDSILVRDTTTKKPEVEDIVYQIPPMHDVIVTAIVGHSVPLSQMTWTIPGFAVDLQPFAAIASNDLGNSTLASVQIPKDYLVPNGIYQINLTATDQNGGAGWAVTSFMVLSPVVGCELNVTEYEAFQMIPVHVGGCAVSDHNKPLSYQVFFYHKSNLVSLSPPQYHLPVDIMGPPSLNASSDENVFAVRVCDVMDSCWWFNSSVVKVRPARDMHATAEHAFIMASISKLSGDYLACLRRHALYLWAITSIYRIKYAVEFESQLAEALICSRRAAEVQCNNSECYSNFFALLMAIPVETLPGRDFLLLEIVDKAIAKLERNNLTLTPGAAQEAFLILEKIYKYNDSNVETAKLVGAMEEKIEKMLARGLHLGQTSVLVDSTGAPVVAMRFTLPSEVFKLDPQGTNMTVGLELGKSLQEKFESWKCEGENGTLCRGIVSNLQFYPTHLYRPFEVDANNTVSDIVAVVLLNPATGERFPEDEKFVLRLTANGSMMHDNLTYNCYYWDKDDQHWSSKDVVTTVTNSTTFFCKGRRMSVIYAVIGTVPRLSDAVIAGIVLGILAGLVVIAVIAFLAYKKSRTKTMRVSMSKGYQPNVQ